MIMTGILLFNAYMRVLALDDWTMYDVQTRGACRTVSPLRERSCFLKMKLVTTKAGQRPYTTVASGRVAV